MAEKLVAINGKTAWTVRGIEIIGSIVAAVLAAYIFLDQRHDGLRERLTAVESNRFTSDDGQDVWREIAKIEAEIARIPTQIPPTWFLNRVEGLDGRLRALEQTKE